METWLESTPYSTQRKEQLLKGFNEAGRQLKHRHLHVKVHGKVETYEVFKLARGICSRHDNFKCMVGPAFRLIEAEVYKHPAFIKHVPVHERPRYIQDMLGVFAGPFLETDYTSFESHFIPLLLDSCELVVYRYMLKNFPVLSKLISKTLTSVNVCRSRYFSLEVPGKRMSGEMCTSLGNGLTNLLLADFIARSKGGRLVGVVEGDDGLFKSTVPLCSQDFKDRGFTIKMLHHQNLYQTTFCGMMSSRDLMTMANPTKVLLNFGWSHSPLMFGGKKVRDGLLRAKAMSLAYEHPQCPILSALALRVLVLTNGVEPRFDVDWYNQHRVKQLCAMKEETAALLAKGPSLQCRMDFASVYGVSISKQLLIEAELSQWTCGKIASPHTLSLFDGGFVAARTYNDRYLTRFRVVSW